MKIKELRLKLKLSQDDLAMKCDDGISATYISKLERGVSKATEDKIILLAIALETDPNTLLDWEEVKKNGKVNINS